MRSMVFIKLLAVCLATPASCFPSSAAGERAELLEVYRAVRDNSPQLAAAQALHAAQLEQLPQAQGQLLPSLTSSFTMLDTHTTGGQGNRDASFSSPQYQISLRQPLINASHWFQLRGAHRAVALATLEYRVKQQAIILETAQAYIETLRAEDERTAIAAERKAFKQQLEQAQGRLQGGLSTLTDVLDAQAAYDTAQASHHLSQGRLDDAYEQLFKLTHQRYSSISRIDPALPVVLPTPASAQLWVEMAMAQNLSLAASATAVDVAAEAVSQRRSAHAPTVDATASYRRDANDPYAAAGGALQRTAFGLEVNLALYSGGRTQSQLREAHSRLTEAEETHHGLQREVVSQVRRLYRTVHSDAEQIRARRQSLLSSQASLEATQIGADTGTRNMLDVLNAHQRRFRAQRDLDNARYDYVLDNLRLKSYVGTLSEADFEGLARNMKKGSDPPLTGS